MPGAIELRSFPAGKYFDDGSAGVERRSLNLSTGPWPEFVDAAIPFGGRHPAERAPMGFASAPRCSSLSRHPVRSLVASLIAPFRRFSLSLSLSLSFTPSGSVLLSSPSSKFASHLHPIAAQRGLKVARQSNPLCISVLRSLSLFLCVCVANRTHPEGHLPSCSSSPRVRDAAVASAKSTVIAQGRWSPRYPNPIDCVF